MDREKLQELKRRPIADLQKRLAEEREKISQLKFDVAVGKIDSAKEIGKTKKNIAQILTIINQKNHEKA